MECEISATSWEDARNSKQNIGRHRLRWLEDVYDDLHKKKVKGWGER
jgi:kynurenine formamidase